MLAGSIVALALGDRHSMILKQDGSVWSTAMNSRDVMIPSHNVSTHFVQTVSSSATAVDAGTSFSIVL